MVLDMAKRKNKQSFIWPGMRGRDAVRKSTPKVNILQVFTIDFSEIQFIGNHNSQSDGQNKSAESGMKLRKKTMHIVSLQRKGEEHKGQWYLTLNKAGNNGPMEHRSDFRAALMMKNHLHNESGEPIEEPLYPGQQRRIQQGQEVFSEDYFSSARVDQHTGWEFWRSSRSSSW